MTLTWTGVGGATSYKIFRSTTSGSFPPTPTYTVSGSPFTDTGLTNGTTYYYIVKAVVGGIDSNPSNQAQATPMLPVPIADNGYGSGASAIINWESVTGANSYNVLRSTTSGTGYSTVPGGSGVAGTTFTDPGLSIGTTYYYVITANFTSGMSGYSNQVSATPIAAPSGLSASAGDGVVNLGWGSVAAASSYYINRSTSASGPFNFISESSTTSYSDSSVFDGVTYYYCVKAVSNAGDISANSTPPASVTPQGAGQASVLFVVGTSPIPAGTPDAAINTRLINLGYSVVVKPGGGTGAVSSTDATGKKLVLISGTVNPSDINNPDGTNKFKTATVPLLTWNAGTYNSLGMTGSVLNTDFGTASGQTALTVWDPSNPIITNLTSLPQPVTVVNSADTFSWGSPGGFASTAATTPPPASQSVIFSYNPGDPMPGVPSAPSKRIGFFMSASTATNLNSTGQSLFDSAVQWATGAPAQPKAVWVSVGDGQVTVNWDFSMGATRYNVMRSMSPNGPFTVIASGVTGTFFVDSGLTNGTTYYYEVMALNGNGQSSSSQVISGIPDPTTILVAITGAKHIRRKLTTDPVDHWNSRVFSAAVIQDQGVYDASRILPTGGANQWWTISGPAIIQANPGQTATSCTVVASDSPSGARGDVQLTYSVKVNVGTVQNPSYKVVPPVVCNVEVTGQITVQLRFHFPNDSNAKRTQWDKMGYPNLFQGDANDTTYIRIDERIRLAADLTAAVAAWDQSALNFYSLAIPNDDLNEKVGPGEGNWDGDALNVIDQDGRTVIPSASQFRTLNDVANFPDVVNVYVVHAISDPGIAAGTVGSFRSGNSNPFIVLTDIATPTTDAKQTLAHELGHILGLPHSDDVNSPFFPPPGVINNVRPRYISSYPRYYLMYTNASNQLGWLVNEDESESVRSTALSGRQGTGSIINHKD